jgi:hypothetical protein
MRPVGRVRSLWAGYVQSRSRCCARSVGLAASVATAHADFPLVWAFRLAGADGFFFGFNSSPTYLLSAALAQSRDQDCPLVCGGRGCRGSHLLGSGRALTAHMRPWQHYRLGMKPRAVHSDVALLAFGPTVSWPSPAIHQDPRRAIRGIQAPIGFGTCAEHAGS